MGRPSKYETHIKPNLQVIQGWIRNDDDTGSKTEPSIAKRLGVGYTTWKRYKVKHEEFREALTQAHQSIVALAVNSLVRQMLGYTVEEKHTELYETGQLDAQGNPILRRVYKKVVKHIAPSLGATCLILFNKDPKNWKDKHEIKHSGEIRTSGVLLTQEPIKDTNLWQELLKQEGNAGGTEAGTETRRTKSSGPLSPEANRRF